jgi:hypothetical protein
MPRVHIVCHQTLHVTLEHLSAGLDEDEVACVQSERWHAARAEVLLPVQIQLRICSVVVEQRELRLLLSLTRKQRRVEHVRLRRDAREQVLGYAVRVLPLVLGLAKLQEREERVALGAVQYFLSST